MKWAGVSTVLHDGTVGVHLIAEGGCGDECFEQALPATGTDAERTAELATALADGGIEGIAAEVSSGALILTTR